MNMKCLELWLAALEIALCGNGATTSLAVMRELSGRYNIQSG